LEGAPSAGLGLGAGLPLGQQMGHLLNTGQQENQQSVHEKLSNLKKLLDDGLITEEQFKEKQAKLVEDL
jgi:hypothetical protein